MAVYKGKNTSEIVFPLGGIGSGSIGMTGFEYALAGLFFAEGKYDDGVELVQSIRSRYDGEKRNPFNEYECGSNYVRSMASWALIPIISGFSYDMTNGEIGFNPRTDKDFSVVWSVGEGWGTFERVKNSIKIIKKGGNTPFTRIVLPFITDEYSFKTDVGKAYFKNGILHVESEVTKITIIKNVG